MLTTRWRVVELLEQVAAAWPRAEPPTQQRQCATVGRKKYGTIPKAAAVTQIDIGGLYIKASLLGYSRSGFEFMG